MIIIKYIEQHMFLSFLSQLTKKVRDVCLTIKVDIQSKDAHDQTLTISSFANYMSTLYKKMTPDSWFDYSMEVKQLTHQFLALDQLLGWITTTNILFSQTSIDEPIHH